MKWRVLIINDGIRAQLLLGDADTIQNEIAQYSVRKRIELAFTVDDIDIVNLLSIRWFEKFGNEIEDEYEKAIIAIQNTGGAHYASQNGFGYLMVANSCKPDCIEVTAELDDASSYTEFSKNYGSSIDGALNILSQANSVISGAGSDPAKTVAKWIKRLRLEKELGDD